VIQAPRIEQSAEWLIRAACRRLPADVRADRCREWAAELPAILDDQSIRLSSLRSLRALTFCAGLSRTTRQLSRSARAGSRRTRNSRWHSGAVKTGTADVALRAVVGAAAWLVVVFSVIALLHTHPDPRGWPFLLVVALAIAFDAFCLADIARVERVRCLPKWAWVLICLIQSPGGGIVYLSIGHISRPRPLPPGEAKP
jgi:Phospholipase_D-nuclease N-terminal